MSPLSLPLLVAEAYRGVVLAAPIDVTPTPPPNTDKVSTLLGYMAWGGTICAVVGIIICGYKFMLAGDRHSNDGAGALGKVGLGMVLVGAASGIVAAVMG